MRSVRELGSRDSHRQRQAATESNDRSGGIGLRLDAIRSDQLRQQINRLVKFEDLQTQPLGCLEAAERRSARREGGAAWARRQQRAHLGLAPRVVQHDKNPPVGQPGAIERESLLSICRNGGSVHAQSVEEPGQDLARMRRSGLAPLEIYEELPVRKARSEEAGGVDGEGSSAR